MRAGLGVAAAAAVLVGSVLLGGVAAAEVQAKPTVDPQATLDSRGRTIEVTGSVLCDPGDRVALVVTVMDGDGYPSGKTRFHCDTTEQPWSVTVRDKGKDAGFAAGAVEVMVTALDDSGSSETAGPVLVTLVAP